MGRARVRTGKHSLPGLPHEVALTAFRERLFKDLLRRLTDYRIVLDAGLDQQHIVDPDLLDDLVSLAEVGRDDTVLEIGPGIGNVTELLAERARRVYAVERDRRFEKILQDRFGARGNVDVVFSSVLDIRLPVFDKVVSNLPFAICEGVFQKLCGSSFKVGALITPVTFARTITAKPESPEASRLSMMSSAFFETSVGRLIEPDSFYPAPGFRCALVKVRPYDAVDLVTVAARQLFLQRDKKGKNALRKALLEAYGERGKTMSKLAARRIVEAMRLDPSILETKIGAMSGDRILQVIQELRRSLGENGLKAPLR